MNVLLIKSKTKLQYFVYIVSWKSTRRPTCNIDKTLKISLLRNLFVPKMTLQWKQTKKILTESKNQKTEIDASTEHPVITSWNQCLDSSTFFFLCVAAQGSKGIESKGLEPKIWTAQTILFLLECNQFMGARAQSARTEEELPDCTSHIGNRG